MGLTVCTTSKDYLALRRLLAADAPDQAWFVPTMGALHDGHASLVRQAAALRDAASPGTRPGVVVVSIFVNPTQFNDPKDFSRYPKTLDGDIEICKAAGADIVFAPAVEDVYPPNAPTTAPTLPAVATQPGLEDALRPGHFAGVCQVVKRLFELVHASTALFGEKDWQQLCVIRAMVAELRLPIRIVPGETVREPDGLAMSSRNRFLSPAEREQATAVSRALRAGNHRESPDEARLHMLDTLVAAGLEPEYAVVRDAQTLMPLPRLLEPGQYQGRALIAARLGAVRLIDNAEWHAR